MKLLVAIDFSEVTDKITAKVKELALKVNAKIWLIHVVQPEPDFVGYDVGPETERDFMAKKFHEKHIKIQNIAKDLENEGIKITPLLVQGPTVETILNQAEKLNVDIIVSGSHGHGAMFRLLVGSISEGLLHNSTKPLLIIPARN
jgi:nucleotide-binding universal stress UspA family protein